VLYSVKFDDEINTYRRSHHDDMLCLHLCTVIGAANKGYYLLRQFDLWHIFNKLVMM